MVAKTMWIEKKVEKRRIDMTRRDAEEVGFKETPYETMMLIVVSRVPQGQMTHSAAQAAAAAGTAEL